MPVEEKTTIPEQNTPDAAASPAPKTYWLYWFICWVFRTFGKLWLRQEIIGLENIPKTGAVLILPTHTSFVDPPLVGSNIPRECHYLAREGILKVPIMGPMLLTLNTHPIRRGASDREAIRTCRNILKSGFPLLFFPEGTRSPNGKLGPIQGGFAMILDGLDIPYIPVMTQSSYRIMPKGALFPLPRKLTLIYGKPAFLPERREGESTREFYRRCAEQIERDYRALGAQ